MSRLVRFGVVLLLQLGALMAVMPAAQADASKALVNNDYVRVREKPSKDAPSIGFLYKNMVVEIKSQTQTMEKIGNDNFYWYEVKGAEASGWVYGKFLTPSAANWNVDTYDAPGDVDWLYKRFGESTWYDTQKMNMTSFSLDDYRNLMVAAENGNEQAWSALRITILQHLKENPYDANYAYLRKRLYSDEFLTKIITYPFAFGDMQFFDVVPYSRNVLIAALKLNANFVYGMPDEYWNDPEVVRQIQANCSQHVRHAKWKAPADDPGAKLHESNAQKVSALCERGK